MRTLLLAFLFGTAAAIPVYAADMPVKAPPAPYVAPASDWTGFYLFGFGGYSSGKISPDDFNVADIVDGFHNPKPKGAVFGFGGGYNWQYNRFVGGLEADYGFSNEKDSQSICLIETCTGTESVSLGLASKIDALGSARIRLGFLLGDSFLLYGTGGLGFARSQATVSLTETFGAESRTISATAKANNFGWVAGAGAEFKLFETGLRLRAEYLHYDFGSTTYAFQTPFIVGVNVNAKTTDDVVRGALIWSFH